MEQSNSRESTSLTLHFYLYSYSAYQYLGGEVAGVRAPGGPGVRYADPAGGLNHEGDDRGDGVPLRLLEPRLQQGPGGVHQEVGQNSRGRKRPQDMSYLLFSLFYVELKLLN
jgi:hypothetical protein